MLRLGVGGGGYRGTLRSFELSGEEGPLWVDMEEERSVMALVAVHHDGRIGMIEYMQRAAGRDPFATEVGEVDYVKMAEAAGLKSIRVEDPSAIGPAWDWALAEDRPVLVEFTAGHEFPRPSLRRFIDQAT